MRDVYGLDNDQRMFEVLSCRGLRDRLLGGMLRAAHALAQSLIHESPVYSERDGCSALPEFGAECAVTRCSSCGLQSLCGVLHHLPTCKAGIVLALVERIGLLDLSDLSDLGDQRDAAQASTHLQGIQPYDIPHRKEDAQVQSSVRAEAGMPPRDNLKRINEILPYDVPQRIREEHS